MTTFIPIKSQVIQGIQNWNRHLRESSGREERDIIDVYAEEKLQLSDSDYQNIINEYKRREEGWEQFIGHKTTYDPNSLDFAKLITAIISDAEHYIHVLTDPPSLRLGIATGIVKNEVFRVSHFSDLLGDSEFESIIGESSIEYDVENKILEFIRERRSTFYDKAKFDDIHHVKAKFYNKKDLWWEFEIWFYNSQHKHLDMIVYPKKDCDLWDPHWTGLWESVWGRKDRW